ncbi:MAG: hypothetical protein ACI8Q1_002024 [Parvicella sp.]|jgi:hypothetical protein
MQVFHFNSYYHTNDIHRRLLELLQREGGIHHVKVSNFLPFFVKSCLGGLQTKGVIVHAHTVGRDGYKALLLKFFLRIPYTVTVRNTDINIHWKKRVLRPYLFSVLFFSSSVLTINLSYKKKLPLKIRNKCEVVPHFIESAWLRNRAHNKVSNIIEFVYVGRLNKIDFNILKAVVNSISNESRIQLFSPSEQDKALAASNDMDAIMLSRSELFESLKKVDIHLFLSRSETFGMAALETCAMGIPTIIQRGEGIFDFLPKELQILACDVDNVNQVCASIRLILLDYERFSDLSYKFAQSFSAANVLAKYKKFYLSISTGQN